MKVVLGTLKLAFWAFVLSLPVLGMWLASSLAAYAGWSTALAITAGLVAFPVLPVLWEVLAARLRARRIARRKSSSFLTDMANKRRDSLRLRLFDRLFLRTLATSAVFVFGTVLIAPGHTFAALTTRGAWMLDGVEGPVADGVRDTLLDTSEAFAWLHRWTHPNQFDGLAESDTPAPPSLDELPDDDPGVTPTRTERQEDAWAGLRERLDAAAALQMSVS